jgi:hypothetical protein
MNPVLKTLREHLPARTVYLNTLRRPASPLVFNFKLPGNGRFIRREEFEPATENVVVRSAEVTRDVTVSIQPRWDHIEQVEEWLEESAWATGAWDMVRFSKPPEADPDHWRDHPGNGIGVAFCGLDAIYRIPGSTGVAADDNWSLGAIAAREGWWSWCFRPNAGWPKESIELKIALRGDVRLRPDGSRDLPFPGWLRSERFAGRSGDWWLGLAKSFEVSDDPTTALRIVWDFRKRTLGLRS